MSAANAKADEPSLQPFPSLLARAGGVIAAAGAVMLGALLSCGAAPARAPIETLDIMPAPAHAVPAPGLLRVDAAFGIRADAADDRARAAIARLLAAWRARTGIAFAPAGAKPALVVVCRSVGPELPALGEDESYVLRVRPAGGRIEAATEPGALRGLSTVQQLLRRGAQGWYLPCVTVTDAPRFAWRGLLVDVSRHWEPPEVLRRTLDGMALVKLNVLHLHLTDDQGFRVEVKSHPELTREGSDGHFYTQAQLRDIVAYAAARGIRVMPEFDVPGHTMSWLVSHPELAGAPGPYRIERHWGVFDPVMDPTNAAVYALLSDVFGEMARIFPDPFFHIGGDENNGVQWSANPRIQAFIRSHGLRNNAGLQAYFNLRVAEILRPLGKRMVGWDEILDSRLSRETVIESWRGSASLAKAAGDGFDGILAHGFYIDTCLPAASYYDTRIPEHDPHVLGGEATMWGEWVTPTTIDSRVWPRTAAIAERLWSPARLRDVPDMYRRLAIVNRRLEEAGLSQASYRGPLLKRLLGGAQAPGATDALTMFLDAVEPVVGYERHKQMPSLDQWTPLTGVADVAAPDCRARLELLPAVKRLLAMPVGERVLAAAAVRARLAALRSAGLAIGPPGGIASRAPGLAPVAPLAVQLADASEVGIEALDRISTGRAAPAAWRATADLRLSLDGEPHDAVQIAALIDAVQRLVSAAMCGSPPAASRSTAG